MSWEGMPLLAAAHSPVSTLERQIWRAQTVQHGVASVCGKINPDGKFQKGNLLSLLSSPFFQTQTPLPMNCCINSSFTRLLKEMQPTEKGRDTPGRRWGC